MQPRQRVESDLWKKVCLAGMLLLHAIDGRCFIDARGFLFICVHHVLVCVHPRVKNQGTFAHHVSDISILVSVRLRIVIAASQIIGHRIEYVTVNDTKIFIGGYSSCSEPNEKYGEQRNMPQIYSRYVLQRRHVNNRQRVQVLGRLSSQEGQRV